MKQIVKPDEDIADKLKVLGLTLEYYEENGKIKTRIIKLDDRK